MGFLNKYPYTDFHELNLDYILQVMKTVETTLTDFVSLNAIKYADPIQWSITRQYEKNTVVIDPLTGTAYISVAPVPIGAALTRTEYWTVVFDLEQFVTKASENFANTYEAQTTTTATQATPQYGWLVWGGILYVANTNITPGDAYVVDGNITRITVEDICGHIQTLNTTDKSNLVAAINEVLATLISMTGDLNSLSTTDKSNLVAAINEVITTFNAAVLDIQTDMGDLVTLTTTDKSSLVNAINEVLASLVSAVTTIDGVTGDLANLTTTDKTSLVNAINEVLATLTTTAGNLADLTTTDTSNLVNAINEVLATLTTTAGNLASLNTGDKSNLVAAINEVLASLISAVSTIDGVTGDLANLTTTDKTSLVNAINELNTAISGIISDIGDLASLNTSDKSSLVNAINEVLASSREIVTPQMYGAAGDGVTDDTDALTTCITDNSLVFIPKGIYLVTDTIEIPEGHTIMMEGDLKTFLTFYPIESQDLSNYAVIKGGANVHLFEINKNVRIYGGIIWANISDVPIYIDMGTNLISGVVMHTSIYGNASANSIAVHLDGTTGTTGYLCISDFDTNVANFDIGFYFDRPVGNLPWITYLNFTGNFFNNRKGITNNFTNFGWSGDGSKFEFMVSGGYIVSNDPIFDIAGSNVFINCQLSDVGTGHNQTCAFNLIGLRGRSTVLNNIFSTDVMSTRSAAAIIGMFANEITDGNGTIIYAQAGQALTFKVSGTYPPGTTEYRMPGVLISANQGNDIPVDTDVFIRVPNNDNRLVIYNNTGSDYNIKMHETMLTY